MYIEWFDSALRIHHLWKFNVPLCCLIWQISRIFSETLFLYHFIMGHLKMHSKKCSLAFIWTAFDRTNNIETENWFRMCSLCPHNSQSMCMHIAHTYVRPNCGIAKLYWCIDRNAKILRHEMQSQLMIRILAQYGSQLNCSRLSRANFCIGTSIHVSIQSITKF